MRIESHFKRGKADRQGQPANAEIISTLFQTQSSHTLAQHRSDNNGAALDFGQWLAELSQLLATVHIGRPNPRRKRTGKRPVGLVLMALALAAFCLPAKATQQLTLAWNASPSPGVTGYTVHYGSSSSNYTSHVNVGTNLTTVIAGLKEGQTNFFSVTAYDSTGAQSDPSNEIKFIVPGVLVLNPKAKATDAAKLQFPVAPMHWYEVQASTNLTAWTTIHQTSVSSSNAWVQVTDTQGATMPKRFYRLVLH